jgi:hypothetical protein
VLGPLLLIVLGVLFLLNNLYPGLFRFGKMWPVILIVIGLAKVFEYLQGEKPVDRPMDRPFERTEEHKEGQ